MTARYVVGDVFDGIATLADDSVDLIVTSPPFLALRSYLPADHEHKSKELGSEATPGEYLDRLLDVVEACARVLAPHGSLVFELGDTYAGSGGAGGDYNEGGLRDGAPGFDGSARAQREGGRGWPLDKSKVLIPQLFAIALAYGFNPLTGRETEPWRVRNTVAWCRPNPPVGRDGDKFRPATSFLTVACKARDRFWDGDAVRTPVSDNTHGGGPTGFPDRDRVGDNRVMRPNTIAHPAGAPLLDYWVIPTSPYRGAWQGDTLYRASRDCPEHSLRALHQTLRTASHDALRESWLRNSRRTDLDPAAKRACAQFANSDLGTPDSFRSMQDWLDQSIRSERRTESNAASRTPTPPNGDSPSVDARTVGRTSRTPVPPTSTDQTWAPLDLEYAPTATPRSTASSKTDRALATSPSGTPSAETPGDTARTSESPASSAPRPDTSASRTSVGGSDEDHPQKQVRIADRCTCEQYTESGSHYATYPPDLVVPLVKAMCPARVCRVCGKPSERITGEVEYERTDTDRVPARLAMLDGERVAEGVNQHTQSNGANTSVTRNAPTLGWSDCLCIGTTRWRPGMILDPFAGSGTTLSVATGHGFDCIGIDLDERNADLARERVGMFLDIEYGSPPAAEALTIEPRF